MAEFASKGVAGAGLGLGIAGTALGVLNNGGMGGLFGGNNNNVGCCSENTPVTRYELDMALGSAAKDSKIALLEANIFTDSKINELGSQTRVALDGVRSELREVAVYQGVNTANIACLKGQVTSLQNEFDGLTKTVIPASNICDSGYPVQVVNTPCNPVYTAVASTSTSK